MKTSVRSLWLTLFCFAGVAAYAAPHKPNIVYILADDLGYGDVQCLNPKRGKIATPHIDKLAAQGMVFTDAHSSSSVCTPTRYGVLTGRYNWRTRLQKGVLHGFDKPLIAADRLTVAELLKEHGYTTACIGKWHLGLGIPKGEPSPTIPFGPISCGFDRFFGIAASLDMPPYAFIENDHFTEELTTTKAFFKRRGPAAESFEAVGAKDSTAKSFSDNIEAILRECSLRYGEKLKGFGYIDGALGWDYHLNPSFEGWARAIKAGNPKALVGFSTNRGPAVSPFSDLAVTDGGSELRQPDSMLIGPGRQFGDVTPAWWCLMDTWYFSRPLNGKFSGRPRHSVEKYVDFFQRMEAAKIPVTINLAMTADVTDEHPIFNPQCMAVMEEVRKAIRGK